MYLEWKVGFDLIFLSSNSGLKEVKKSEKCLGVVESLGAVTGAFGIPSVL